MKRDPEMPAVSVVMGAYNAAPWIGEALESVLAQTYQDFEIIVVDDGSTDATPEVVARFGEAVTYVRTTNRGSASARNRGIREARGRYVALHDADDFWHSEKLESQMRYFEEDPEPAWCYTNAQYFDAESRRPLHTSDQFYGLPEGDVLRVLLLGNFMAVPSVVLRRDVFDAVGYFDESPERRISEDWDFWLRVAARYPVRCVREPLTWVRLHSTQKTRTMDLDRALRLRCSFIEAAVRRDPDRLQDIRRRALAGIHFNIARKWLDREARTQARRTIAAAIRLWPWHPQAWAYGIATFLPRSILRQLGRMREKWRAQRGVHRNRTRPQTRRKMPAPRSVAT